MKNNIFKLEWTWSNKPIILPLAYQPREWNAVYIAFYLAEYSGSKVLITHISQGDENPQLINEFKDNISKMAKEINIQFEYLTINPPSKTPSVDDIAKYIDETSIQNDAQAIVMSAHREAFFRELFGRVSDHVVRVSRKRVVLVETPQTGVNIPKNPRRILIPVLKEDHPDPFILAAALTSSAFQPDVELIAVRVIELPPTVPLDVIEVDHSLRKVERNFYYFTSQAIQTLGRPFTPKILPVRNVGRDLLQFAQERGVDVIIIYSSRQTGFYSFLTKNEYDIVSKAPCIVLVTLPEINEKK